MPRNRFTDFTLGCVDWHWSASRRLAWSPLSAAAEALWGCRAIVLLGWTAARRRRRLPPTCSRPTSRHWSEHAGTYSAETSNVSGAITYQWSRIDRRRRHLRRHSRRHRQDLLARQCEPRDDGAMFKVVVNGGLSALSHLAVSATPGLVFEDGDFQATDWLVTPLAIPGASAPAHAEERVATGGNPGAFRRMVFEIAAQTSAARVCSIRRWWPSTTRKRKAPSTSSTMRKMASPFRSRSTSTQSAMLLEQGGRRYRRTSGTPFAGTVPNPMERGREPLQPAPRGTSIWSTGPRANPAKPAQISPPRVRRCVRLLAHFVAESRAFRSPTASTTGR